MAVPSLETLTLHFSFCGENPVEQVIVSKLVEGAQDVLPQLPHMRRLRVRVPNVSAALKRTLCSNIDGCINSGARRWRRSLANVDGDVYMQYELERAAARAK